MKATGIVRRIDDLGRIVIPKEIRRTLHIRETDPLEIFTDTEGQIVLKKYSPMGEMKTFAEQYVDSLSRVSGYAAMITDRDRIIAVAGGFREYLDQEISRQLQQLMECREVFLTGEHTKQPVPIDQEGDMKYCGLGMAPILCAGDIIGSVLLLEGKKQGARPMGEVEKKLLLSAATFLGKQMEE